MSKSKSNAARLKSVAKKQKQATESQESQVVITMRDAALLGVLASSDDERPHVNLKYYYHEHQCFSDWSSNELKAFSSFCRKLSQMRWAEIYMTGGSVGHKTGLGYTRHKDLGVLPENPELSRLSPDLTWFELRIDGESRVHGFRVRSAFFLVFLDRAHEIYPS